MDRELFVRLIKDAGFSVWDGIAGAEEIYCGHLECTGPCERLAALMLAHYAASTMGLQHTDKVVAELTTYFLGQIRPRGERRSWTNQFF